MSLPQAVCEAVWIVIPAFNEELSIGQVVREARLRYPNVVVVDDGSVDRTYAIARSEATWTVRHIINRGQGAALQTGITFALAQGAHYVVTFDGDEQHRAQDIDAMVKPLYQGECDVTLGSRFLGEEAVGMPSSRRLTLKLAILFSRLLHGVKITDTHCGLRGFTRSAAEQISITLDRMAHASEILDFIKHEKLAFREVPVQVHYTSRSIAKGQSLGDAFKIVIEYFLGRILP